MARPTTVEQLRPGDVFVLNDDRRLLVRTVMATRRYNEQGNQYVLLEWRKTGCDKPRGAMTAVVSMGVDVLDMLDDDEAMNEIADMVHASESGDCIRIFNCNERFYA